MRRESRLDALVIGAGTAGLTAAARLAQGGARVAVLAKGVGSTHLAPGTIDVLGYHDGERVQRPGAALGSIEAPHPYALVGPGAVERALAWFGEAVRAGPLPAYAYEGGLEENVLLPTALGVLRPSALVPETMAAGAGREPVCVVGVRGLRDFHPSLCAANLARIGVPARGLELDPALDRADQNALGLARRFDEEPWRAAFCAELAPRLRGGERVALAAVLGLSDPHAVWEDVQRRLGRPVFEIPTLPPSVPGMRLFEILSSALRRAGGRLVLGCQVVGAEWSDSGERLEAVLARVAGGERRYAAQQFVLASGGVASGAVEMDSWWRVRERVLGLELAGLPPAGRPRFTERYLDEQPIARLGVAVADDLRAVGRENVFVAGAALAGAAAWREGSGEGIALATGLRAAEAAAGALQPSGAGVGAA